MAKVNVKNRDRPTTDRATAKPVKPKKKPRPEVRQVENITVAQQEARWSEKKKRKGSVCAVKCRGVLDAEMMARLVQTHAPKAVVLLPYCRLIARSVESRLLAHARQPS